MNFSEPLKNNRDFLRAYNRGKNSASPLFVVYARQNKNGKRNRIGITVSTKIGKAVVRNHIRRRVREIYRLHELEFNCGYDIVIVARQKSRFAEFAEMEKDIIELSSRLGLLTKKDEEIIAQSD